MKFETDDLRIASIKAVTPPREVCEEIPISEAAARTTWETRNAIHALLTGQDDRLMVVAGPCSIHDPAAALDYGRRLLALKRELERDLLVVMRVYFEKPRTTIGWKGLINDPDLDGSFHINKGLRLARQLLRDLNEMGMPAGTEFLDIITPQYVADLVSWGAIGARTTESQVHREVASGLSCPVGFKNGTDGTTQIAVDAVHAASVPHNFLSLRKEGNSAIFITRGNPDCHVILRGGKTPNYDAESIRCVAGELERARLPVKIMIDFSHANSGKQHERQVEVARDVGRQLAAGESRIFGVMLESHLVEGRQDVVPGRKLVYGQSITDACLGWDQTEPLLRDLARAVAARRKN
jgi:3-deoxy-7-phosphoheptulonate synthase